MKDKLSHKTNAPKVLKLIINNTLPTSVSTTLAILGMVLILFLMYFRLRVPLLYMIPSMGAVIGGLAKERVLNFSLVVGGFGIMLYLASILVY